MSLQYPFETVEESPSSDDAEYRRHDIELRDVQDNQLVVSYNAIKDSASNYTEARHVSTKLPVVCLVLFDGGTVDVSDLSTEERLWIEYESQQSNEIDFSGTETGESIDEQGVTDE